jgi:hypothetical protein
LRIGIGDARLAGLIGKSWKMGELAATALAYHLGQLVVEVGEEQEGRLGAPLIPHKQQRYLGAEQQQRRGGVQAPGIGQQGQTLAHGAVADLVVVLQEADESRGRQMAAGRAAFFATLMRRRIALIDKTLRQTASQLCAGSCAKSR